MWFTAKASAATLWGDSGAKTGGMTHSPSQAEEGVPDAGSARLAAERVSHTPEVCVVNALRLYKCWRSAKRDGRSKTSTVRLEAAPLSRDSEWEERWSPPSESEE